MMKFKKNRKNRYERSEEKVKTISLVNVKGGVGKTTSTVNIAACLNEKGYRVLVIDADSQGNCSLLFNAYDEKKVSISNLFQDDDGVDINLFIRYTDYEGLDILPSNLSLSVCERDLLVDKKRMQQYILKKALKYVQSDYDYCIIDCPPHYLSIMTINALVASDEVLVPTDVDDVSIAGLEALLVSINEIRDKYNEFLKFRGCFVTRDVTTNINKRRKEMLKKSLKNKLFNTTIRNTVKVKDSMEARIPLVFFDKRATASTDYMNLVDELLEGENDE